MRYVSKVASFVLGKPIIGILNLVCWTSWVYKADMEIGSRNIFHKTTKLPLGTAIKALICGDITKRSFLVRPGIGDPTSQKMLYCVTREVLEHYLKG